MKKITLFSLLIVACTFFTACGSPKSPETPGEVIKRCAAYIQQGEYEKLTEELETPKEATGTEAEAYKKSVISKIEETVNEQQRKNGDIENTKLVTEIASDDAGTAKVMLFIEYMNGMTDLANIDLVKQDGKWKISLKK